MYRHGSMVLVALVGTVLAAASGCAPSGVQVGEGPDAADASFAALQVRGQRAMGVDQYTSTHLFDALPDGGRIELQRGEDDPAGVAEIRRHLQQIARAFAAGDFSTPAFVHGQPVPGTAVLAAKRDLITYTYRELPHGGEVRITTGDPEAIEAIREFMAFQRQDHRAGGMDHGTDHGTMDHSTMDHGRGAEQGVASGSRDNDFAADMCLVHGLLSNHDAITRTVTNLPNGIRTVTESDDPRVARYLKDHVSKMEQRLKDGDIFNVSSPNLPTIFENRDRIQTDIQRTDQGVIFTQTSDDPATIAALQAHAAEVSDLAREGMVAMMGSMMAGGGRMWQNGAARQGHAGMGMGGMMGHGAMPRESMHRMMTGGGHTGGMHGSGPAPDGDRP